MGAVCVVLVGLIATIDVCAELAVANRMARSSLVDYSSRAGIPVPRTDRDVAASGALKRRGRQGNLQSGQRGW